MDAQAQQFDWKYWAGLGFFIAVLLSVLGGCVATYRHLSDKQLQPMSKLYISGQRGYVLDQELQQALAELPEAGNFFTLDVNEVKDKLEQLPWVKQVTVRKSWPDKLRVGLQQQQVAARWNKAALLNRQGEIFDAPHERIQQPLALLSGPDDQAPQVLQVYQELQQLLDSRQLSLAAVSLSDRHAWSLKLTDGMTLELGQDDRVNRLKRFLALYPQLDSAAIAYIDLRYDTGFAVGWKQEEGLLVDDQGNG
ncbi:cell division protein FtsQ/DivIB [Aliagarivorans marinus]|uniref:cell division protein FtsQ/DivIB n=1 Tax=Aliagarivorans marinus TaxID=561965 RepID=UPI000407C6C3|nr:cell division protein FtsQ/DivIB [Aliagarivorans marinus]